MFVSRRFWRRLDQLTGTEFVWNVPLDWHGTPFLNVAFEHVCKKFVRPKVRAFHGWRGFRQIELEAIL